MTVIDATTTLSGFRAKLTGQYGVQLVQTHGQVLIQLPVGVGKSTWMDQITVEAIASKAYPFVVILSPTQLIVKRLDECKRVLLVCKLEFKNMCIDDVTRRLHALGRPAIRIVGADWSPQDLADPNVISIINYGVIGINAFEHFDAAYCLTGYYVNEKVVNTCLQDVVRAGLRLDIEIQTEGSPKRRTAGAVKASDRSYDVHELAPLALAHQELNPVVQAVGRVRPPACSFRPDYLIKWREPIVAQALSMRCIDRTSRPRGQGGTHRYA